MSLQRTVSVAFSKNTSPKGSILEIRAKQLQYMQTEEFSEYAKFRNGVEAIPSLLRRRYHVDKIPVHGKKRTRLFFGFKIAALDFQKLLDYKKALYFPKSWSIESRRPARW